MTKIIIVGEAWGAKEEMFEHPFVGASGVELARMLSEAGITAELPGHMSELDMINYWKSQSDFIKPTNVFNLHPQDNDIELLFTTAKEGTKDWVTQRFGTSAKALKPEHFHHLETLWKFLETEKPNLILALGNTACWALLGESKISALRGTTKLSNKTGFKVLPTYHPAAVLRQWNLRTIVLADFSKAVIEAEYPSIQRIKRWLIVEPSLEDIVEWKSRPADYYAVDIETFGGQISMIGFARNPHDAIVIPFLEKGKPGWNYWPTHREEITALRLTNDLLNRDTVKIFQNGVYDLSYLLAYGFRPKRCDHDTMLLHHSLYAEMQKSLGFLGSIYSREINWKSMRTKGDNLKRDE